MSFFGAGVGEVGEARPGDEMRLGHQPRDRAAHGVGAQEHGLLLAARVQQAVGEHVAALEVGAELDLVDRQERHRMSSGMASTVQTK